MGDFDGLRIALSALQAQRRQLEVLGHNIANVGTDGYSRQRLGLVARSTTTAASIHARGTGVGLGVGVGSVERLRDAFLEARGQQEHATESGLRRVATSLGRVELAFAEPGENGIAAQLADFLSGWDDVANRPDDVAARTALVERGRTLASSVAQTDSGLASLAATSLEQLGYVTAEVNALAGRVGELNARIQVATRAGVAANDLLDERDRTVQLLGERVGATTRAAADGMVDVFVGGTALVRGVLTEDLEVTVAASVATVRWVKDGLPATTGGEASGLVDTVNDIVPRYRAGLRAVTQQLADEVNALHRTGFALDGVTTNIDFFEIGPGGLAVAGAVAADPRLIAASGVAGATQDSLVARRIAALTATDGSYRELVVGLGVEAQTAQRRVEIQSTIKSQVDSARDAESGVDLDEELTQMLGAQHAYQAAARLMTAVDEAIDQLVNRTGLVGR